MVGKRPSRPFASLKKPPSRTNRACWVGVKKQDKWGWWEEARGVGVRGRVGGKGDFK